MPDAPDNPLLLAALAYIARGWPVVPLHHPAGFRRPHTPAGCSCGVEGCKSVGKHPRTKNGLKDASTDPATVRAWWADYPDANIGLVCGPAADLWVVDLDGEQGRADFAALCAEHADQPVACGWRVRTQGGGEHLYFRWPPGVGRIKNRQRHRGTAIDTRAFGDGPGYVVAPPSRGRDGLYTLEVAGEVTHAPGWLVAWALADDAKPSPAGSPRREAFDADEHLRRRASAYLSRVPEAVDGERGHPQTLKAATSLVVGFGLSEADALAILAAEYNPRCRPPWPESALRHKVAEAAKNLLGRRVGYLRDAADPRAADPPAAPLPPPPAAAAAGPTDWRASPPVPLTRPAADPPPFPLADTLPYDLAEYCRQVSHVRQCPTDLPVIYLLGLASGLIGGTLRLRLSDGRDGWQAWPSLWLGVVADVGRSKTPALNAFAAPARRAIRRRHPEGDAPLAIVTDTTAEGLQSLLDRRPRGVCVMVDELPSLVGGMNQYKARGVGNDRQFWLAAHACSPHPVARAGRQLEVVPHLGIVGGIQPDVLPDLVGGRNDGFFERFLLSWCPPWEVRTNLDPLDGGVWEAAAARLLTREREKGEHGDGPYTLTADAEARALFLGWAAETDRLTNDPNNPVGGSSQKLKEAAARLGLVLWALHRACEVGTPATGFGAEDMARGVAAARYFLAHAHRTRAGLSADPRRPLAERALGWLRDKRAAGGVVTRQELHAGLRRHVRGMGDWKPVLELLDEHGYLFAPEAGPGRIDHAVRAGWLVHPAVARWDPTADEKAPPYTPYTRAGDADEPVVV